MTAQQFKALPKEAKQKRIDYFLLLTTPPGLHGAKSWEEAGKMCLSNRRLGVALGEELRKRGYNVFRACDNADCRKGRRKPKMVALWSGGGMLD